VNYIENFLALINKFEVNNKSLIEKYSKGVEKINSTENDISKMKIVIN